ncbi:MAG: hypothetical protein L6Q68_19665 [Aquabacterium sp.]|nr:hypothetical protein [Aquabacterium sp.]
MSREEITLGSTPCDEPCTGVSQNDYERPMRDECTVHRRMLERLAPPPPASSGALGIKRFGHEFGAYLEVVANFDSSDEAATDWAYDLESNSPTKWDAIALYELQWIRRVREIQAALARGELRTEQVSEDVRLARWPELEPDVEIDELLARHPLPQATAMA